MKSGLFGGGGKLLRVEMRLPLFAGKILFGVLLTLCLHLMYYSFKKRNIIEACRRQTCAR